MLSTCIALFFFPLSLLSFSLIAWPGGNPSTGEPRRCLVVCFSALGSGHLDCQRDFSRPSRICFLHRRLAPFTRLFTGLSPSDASVLTHSPSVQSAASCRGRPPRPPNSATRPRRPIPSRGLAPLSSHTLSSPRGDGIGIRWPGLSGWLLSPFRLRYTGRDDKNSCLLLWLIFCSHQGHAVNAVTREPSVSTGMLDTRSYSFYNAIQP